MKETFLGELVREARKSKGYTMIELAESLGLTQGYVSKIETNKNLPTIEILKKIGEILDIPLIELLFEAGYVEKPITYDDLKNTLTRALAKQKSISFNLEFVHDELEQAKKMNDEEKVKNLSKEIPYLEKALESLDYEIKQLRQVELLHGSNAELKSKVAQYTDEIMKTEIKETNSQKYKELYNLEFKKETIEILLNRYNFEGLSDIGIKQEVKKILDKYLEKVMETKKYMPHSNNSAISMISDRLDVVVKEYLNNYFKLENVEIDRSYLKNDEINPDLSCDLYDEMLDIISKMRDDIYNLKAKYSDD